MPQNSIDLKVLGITPLPCSGYAENIINNFDTYSNNPTKIAIIKNLCPDIVLLYGKYSGIIAYIGSIGCHGANIARELNIPCVVFYNKDIKIPDNTLITFDGCSGILTYTAE